MLKTLEQYEDAIKKEELSYEEVLNRFENYYKDITEKDDYMFESICLEISTLESRLRGLRTEMKNKFNVERVSLDNSKSTIISEVIEKIKKKKFKII